MIIGSTAIALRSGEYHRNGNAMGSQNVGQGTTGGAMKDNKATTGMSHAAHRRTVPTDRRVHPPLPSKAHRVMPRKPTTRPSEVGPLGRAVPEPPPVAALLLIPPLSFEDLVFKAYAFGIVSPIKIFATSAFANTFVDQLCHWPLLSFLRAPVGALCCALPKLSNLLTLKLAAIRCNRTGFRKSRAVQPKDACSAVVAGDGASGTPLAQVSKAPSVKRNTQSARPRLQPRTTPTTP